MAGRGLYEELREEIVSGRMAEGQPLVESVLASRYGTSRTPVREALRRLEQDALVERGDRGLQVRSHSPEEILEIYEVRIELEGMAAAGAAGRHTQLDLSRIASCYQAMADLLGHDPSEMVRLNGAFHHAVWLASHNRTLFDLLDRVNSHLTRYPATTLTSPNRWARVVVDYDMLRDFIASGDAEGARRVAKEHMTAARDIRLAMYAAGQAL